MAEMNPAAIINAFITAMAQVDPAFSQYTVEDAGAEAAAEPEMGAEIETEMDAGADMGGKKTLPVAPAAGKKTGKFGDSSGELTDAGAIDAFLKSKGV